MLPKAATRGKHVNRGLLDSETRVSRSEPAAHGAVGQKSDSSADSSSVSRKGKTRVKVGEEAEHTFGHLASDKYKVFRGEQWFYAKYRR